MESKEPDNKFQDLAPGQGTQHKPGASSQDSAAPTPGKKKILRAIALSVGSLFLIALVVFGWWAYRRWTDMKEIVESARRISSVLEASMGALARPPAGQFSKSSASLHLAMQTSRPGKSKLPVVPFSLGSGGLPRGIPEIVRNPQKIFKALSKYKDRPLVKEFFNDLNSDPEFKKAWEKRSTGNPIKLFSQIHNMKNLTGIIEKYAERPEFAILMIEVMNDPELKPFFEIVGSGVTGRMAAGTGSRPSLESSGSRSPSPEAEGSPLKQQSVPHPTPPEVESERGPAESQGAKLDNVVDPRDADDLQTMTLDPSQIQGNKSTSSVSVRSFVVPPP